MSSPGYGLSLLLEQVPPERLGELAGGTVAVVEAISGQEMTQTARAAFVLTVLDPITLLKDRETRSLLLQYLPVAKLRELARRIEIPETDAKSLLDSEYTPKELDGLLRFVGYGDIAAQALPVGAGIDGQAPAAYALFPHQRDAVHRVVKHLTGRPPAVRRAVLHLPTGAGKTRSAMHVVCRHLRENEGTLVVWLAYSKELLEQAAEEFTAAWYHLGNRDLPVLRSWGSQKPDLLGQRDAFIVSGLSKMYRWADRNKDDFYVLADRTTLTVIDEAHQSVARTYRHILDTFADKHPDAALLGLTATPGRTWADVDADRELSEFFGGHKVMLSVDGYDNPVEYLMAEGYLARPTFRTLDVGAVPGLRRVTASLEAGEDLADEDLDVLAADEHRTQVVVEAIIDLLARHQRVIVFATSVGHARAITGILKALRYDARCVTGDMPLPTREATIRVFKSNAPQPIALVNFGVLTTGFDAPNTSAALIARPTRSLVLYSQMVGRATRGPRAGGNATAEIVTVIDPEIPGFGDVAEAFTNWEDVWG